MELSFSVCSVISVVKCLALAAALDRPSLRS
jgi:hypothetical protein